jgi:hypothetical protein
MLLRQKDFFDTFKIVGDKQIVLLLPAATQARRIQATNPGYAQCIRTNFTFDKDATVAPQGFSALIQNLIANKKVGSDESVEQTILSTIAAQCGSETAPLAHSAQ